MARRSSAVDPDDALELLHFAFRNVTAKADAALAKRGMGRVHHRILYFIRRNSGISVGDLLGTLGITKQSLHRPLQELVDEGFVTSVRSEENRRTKELALTKAGVAMERSLSGPQRALFAKVFAGAPAAAEPWARLMNDLAGQLGRPGARWWSS